MKTTTELFGENLRNQLYLRNKTQSDIARHLKVTDASVSRWVNGQSMPRSAMIDRLCAFLHCTVLTKDKPKQHTFSADWKEVYQMLDDKHKKAFWQNLIKAIYIDEDLNVKGVLY